MKQTTKFGIMMTVGLILIIVALFFMSGIGGDTTEDIKADYECDVWNGYQCLDQESEWYGCNVQEKTCYAYTQVEVAQ